MLRILFYFRKGLRFFKSIKIGLEIGIRAFKATILNHHKYILFCLILTIIFYSRLQITRFFDPRFSISYFFSETFMERNALELLIESLKSLSISSAIFQFFIKISLVLLEFFLTFFITCWVINYVYTNKSIFFCFFLTLKKSSLLAMWTIINLSLYFITAFLPDYIGNTVELLWQLSTFLVLPIITLNKLSLSKILKLAFAFFKKRIGNFICADFFVDFCLILLTALFYYWYKDTTFESVNIISREKTINFLIPVLLCYLQGVLIVTQAVIATSLYKLLYEETI